MAITADVPRHAGPYTGNGSTVAFGFAFKVFSGQHLDVTLTHVDSGVAVEQEYGTHYSVGLNANQDTNPGGTVTMVTAPALGYSLEISGNTPLTQPAIFSDVGGWRPSMLNDALDRLLMQIKEQLGGLTAAQLPVPADGQLLGWDGTQLANFIASTIEIVPGVFYSQRFSGDGTTLTYTLSSAPASVQTVEVFIDGIRQWPGVDYGVSGTSLTFVSAPPAGTNNIAVRWGILLSGSATASTDLTDYVASKFVDHALVSVLAGSGLTGGGTLEANRTLSLNIGGLTEITNVDVANDFLVVLDATDGTHKKVKPQNAIGATLGDGSWRVLSDTALTAATVTVIPFSTILSDDLTRGTYSISTFRYTASESTRVLAFAAAQVLAVNAGAEVYIQLRKNGTAIAYDAERDESDATPRDITVQVFKLVPLAAGDYIDFTIWSTNAETLESDQDKTYCAIVELA